MPAIIAQDNTQRRGEETISAFTQKEKIEMVEISKQPMVEMSTQTNEEEGSAEFSKFMLTKIEDRQENIMVEQSDGMTAPIQESATSIQTVLFSYEIVRVVIRQEGQLIIFVDATRYGEVGRDGSLLRWAASSKSSSIQ